jgi:hypothetical protein
MYSISSENILSDGKEIIMSYLEWALILALWFFQLWFLGSRIDMLDDKLSKVLEAIFRRTGDW